MANTAQQQNAQVQQMLAQWNAQQHAHAQRAQDLAFMRSKENFMYCPVLGASSQNATYSVGSTLYFDLPVAPSGYAKGLLIKYNLAVKPATGSSAVYSVNKAAPWNIFSEIQLLYNGAQARLHPYLLKVLDQTKGFQYGAQNRVLAGNNDATIAANIVGGTPIVVNTDNTWQGQFYLPLNALSDDDVRGLLPVNGAGTHAQLKLTTPSSFLGNDPLIHPISNTSGSGASITIETTSTVSVDMVYLDGSTLEGPQLLPAPPSIYGPTLQFFWEPSLTPINTNAMSRQMITNKLRHHYVVSIVIDGVQSSDFATWSNVSQFEMTGDLTGSQKLNSFNVANNIPIYDYFDRLVRRKIGQDLDPGVILWAASPIRGTVNADNRMGNAALNMTPGGFPTASHGYNVVSPGSPSGYSARVETFLVSENAKGLGLMPIAG